MINGRPKGRTVVGRRLRQACSPSRECPTIWLIFGVIYDSYPLHGATLVPNSLKCEEGRIGVIEG